MEIGFLTACLKVDLEEELIPWCQDVGFTNIEIGGSHAGFFHKDFAEDIKEIFADSNLKITAIGNYQNFLDGGKEEREFKFNALKRVIETAAALDIPIISTHVGRNNCVDYKANIELFKEDWIPVIKFADDLGIKIAIENCPMQRDFGLIGGNLMFAPRIMGDLFSITPDNFGLNFDPSHLIWQMVDIPLIVEEFGDRIFHTHAKDTTINLDTRKFDGVFGPGSYTFRLPGNGQLDWEKYIDTLKDVGYDGVLSIELEDPLYEGTPEKVKQGLIKSRDYLKQFI